MAPVTDPAGTAPPRGGASASATPPGGGSARGPSLAAETDASRVARRAAAPVAWKNIGVLRGIAICLVVVHHATHTVFSIRRSALATHPMAAWEALVEVAGRGLSPVSVPAFLFATGYFVARFTRSWSAARASALRLAGRYAAWSVLGFAAFALKDGHLDVGEAALSFLQGGPFVAYWFFVLMIQLLLLAPLLVAWSERRSGQVLVFAIVLQTCSVVAYYYVDVLQRAHSVLLSGHAVYMRLPFFLYGVLLSRRADAVLAFLAPRRRALTALVLVAAGATCLEAMLLGTTLETGTPDSWGRMVMSSQSATLQVLSFATVGWIISRPSEQTGLRAWLNKVGLRSMTILLLSDAVLIACTVALWQGGRLLGIVTAPGVPPWYMLSPWWLALAAAAGISVPLAISNAVERLAGKRIQNLLFA